MSIINIRGTSGSGKSTVVHNLLSRYSRTTSQVTEFPESKKPLLVGYSIHMDWGPRRKRDVFVVGRYATQCGGCDGVGSYEEIFRRIKLYAADHDHVIFEGLLVSGDVKWTTELATWLDNNNMRAGATIHVGFLDTPINKCLERIQKRRASRGNTKPLDPKNTVAKFEMLGRVRKRLEDWRGPAGEEISTDTIQHKHADLWLEGVLQ